MITAAGTVNVARFQMVQRNQTTPTLDLRCDYAVVVNRQNESVVIKTLNLTGTQNQQPLLHAETTSPLTIAWGKADNAVGEAALNLAITGLNLADWKALRKFPPCLVLSTTDEMAVRQEEIFGPILPVIPYDRTDEAIAYVNSRDRPLALYWFGTDARARDRILHETVAGGVTINDCLLHIAQEHQPFGGVGASGMGAYHGEWGFRTFSKEKPVFYRAHLSGTETLRPPYGPRFNRILALLRRLI